MIPYHAQPFAASGSCRTYRSQVCRHFALSILIGVCAEPDEHVVRKEPVSTSVFAVHGES